MKHNNQNPVPSEPTEALFKFIDGRPQWEQDAVRRIYVQGTLVKNDYEELYDLFRSENNLPTRHNAYSESAVALDIKNLPERSNAQEQLFLNKIHSVQNVERLATGQFIDVGPNLTLIYGDNGAGKSGYTRILKKACGARGSSEAILANVKDPNHTQKGPGGIAVDCTKKSPNGSHNVPVSWNTAKKDPDALLKRVQIFDNVVASHMITKDNDVPVIPYNFDLLDRLANDVFSDLKQKIKADEDSLIRTISSLIDSIPEDFNARATIKEPFQGDRNEMEKRLSGLSDEDTARFNQLHDLINNRDQQIARLEKEALNLGQALSWLKQAYPLLSPVEIRELRKNIALLSDAEKAVTQALPHAFSDVKSLENLPFSGIGSNHWRVLWDAAKEFCTSTAYPQEVFPVTTKADGTNASCPLCLQELQPEAQERFAAFQKFIETSVVKTRDDLKTEINAVKKKIEGINSSYLATEIFLYFADDKPAQARMQEFYDNIALLKNNILKSISDPADVESMEFPALENIETDLQNLKAEKERQLAEARSFDQDPEAPQKRQQYDRLGRRKTLLPHKDTVLQIYDARQLLDKHAEATKKLDTGPITHQKKNLMKDYFNADFIEIFKDEKIALGIRFPAVVNVRQSAAVSLHKPGLEKYHHKKIDDILSEGEKRALALAAFFTELEVANTNDPVIFDDPVSSLDHMYRESVSERLARLAKTRQVIVFTHDLAFMAEIRAKAKKYSCDTQEYHLKTEFDDTGIISDELPWIAQKLGQRISFLQSKHGAAKKLYEANDPQHATATKFVAGHIREAWERLIEEKLFCSVLERYRKSIETKRLRDIGITAEILDEIEKGMTETSNWANHDQPGAFQNTTPSLAAVKAEIERIIKCKNLIEAAQKAIKDQKQQKEKAA